MRAGLGLLRLSPQNFWSLTPRELACAMGRFNVPENVPSRHNFETLMRAFPDREHHEQQ